MYEINEKILRKYLSIFYWIREREKKVAAMRQETKRGDLQFILFMYAWMYYMILA